MRKVFSAVAAITALAATLVGFTPAPGIAAESVADLSVSVDDSPDQVSPPGGIVLYTVTVANNGPVAAPAADFRDTTRGGAFVRSLSLLPAGCSGPADGAADPTIDCRFLAFPAGATRTIEVAIRTPASVGQVTNTVSASIPPGAVFDNNPANDSATDTTAVTATSDGAASLLTQGQSLTYKTHTLTVTSAVNGIITALSTAPAEGAQCGDSACGDGLRVWFDSNPRFQGLVSVDVNFGKGDPCRGLGKESCTSLYSRKDGVVTVVPLCSAAPTASPCIEQIYKVDGHIHHSVRMRSEDPDLLPPLGGGTVG